MDEKPAGQAPPAFSPQILMGLYLRGDHDALSENLLAILRHFRETSYHALDARGRHFVNEFVKAFLNLFTQADYVPSREHITEFVRINLTTSNLVAMSSFGTTDVFLDLLGGPPANLGKFLALYSARNTAVIPRKAIFDADPTLASVWYGAYAEAYRSGLPNARACDNLRGHFASADDRIDVRHMSMDGYFSSSYLDGDCDRVVKSVLNAAVRRVAVAGGLRPRNRPDSRKVAVLSGHWSPIHSVYRICSAYVDALEGYHLTLVQLGRRNDADVGRFQEVRRVDFDKNGVPDLTPLLDNDFAVAYFPDVGLTPQSVLLANLRIAPVQIASLGHSVSTWGADIDYFVSGADVEPLNPERNYSERLVLLPGCGAVHERPDYSPSGRNRKTNAPEFIINCPWNAQKVNHRFCLTLRELIGRSPRKILLRLFASASLDRRNDYLPFVRDLHALLGAGNVEVRHAMAYRDYMALMEEGDLGIDSYPFGGCNTVADSLHIRKLMVTYEGDRWYNRIGSRMLRMVGLPELAATSEEDYLSTTLRLIADDPYRASLQERLDRADLDATIFNRAEARDFRKAVDYLVENHDRLRGETDRSAIRIGP